MALYNSPFQANDEGVSDDLDAARLASLQQRKDSARRELEERDAARKQELDDEIAALEAEAPDTAPMPEGTVEVDEAEGSEAAVVPTEGEESFVAPEEDDVGFLGTVADVGTQLVGGVRDALVEGGQAVVEGGGLFEVDFDLRHLVIDLNILQRDDLELFQG